MSSPVASVSSKPRKFNAADAELARVFRALANPARLKILRILGERGTAVCGEIVDDLPLSQSTVSQHLKELKDAGLIRGEANGTKSCYCLNYGSLRKYRAWIEAYLTDLPDREDDPGCC